jgi:hypothetical protein
MKWKYNTFKYGETRKFKEFLLFPRKHEGYWYWLEWAMLEETWIGHRWSRATKIIEILRPAS